MQVTSAFHHGCRKQERGYARVSLLCSKGGLASLVTVGGTIGPLVAGALLSSGSTGEQVRLKRNPLAFALLIMLWLCQDCSQRLWFVACPDLLGMPFFFGAGLFVLASTSAAHAFSAAHVPVPGPKPSSSRRAASFVEPGEEVAPLIEGQRSPR